MTCCRCRQVEDVKGDVQLAEEKVEKLEAMGGPQLDAAMAAAQAEVQAQEAVVQQQVGSELHRRSRTSQPGNLFSVCQTRL